VMKVGFVDIIQTQSNSRCSGRAHSHQEQKKKKHDRSGVQQRACSLFFFDVNAIVHREFVPANTMVNSDFYGDILRLLRENVR
jgi:hypothetical protein